MRIIEARGPVVDALKRHDPGLRVRWSHEKQAWAVDAPFKMQSNEWMVPPVFFERIANSDYYIEHILPEYSDRNISYKDGRYIVLWTRELDWRLYRKIVSLDSHKMNGGMVGQYRRNFHKGEADKKYAEGKRKDERVYAAWDQFKHFRRKNPWAEDGTGVSIKGMR